MARKQNILLVTAAVAVAGMGLYLLARQGVRIPCVFYELTGLKCPGCGNTRAVVCLLRGDVLGALRYNYLFPVECFYLGWVYCHTARTYARTGRVSYKPICLGLDIAVLAALLLWGILRNFRGL